MNKRQTPSTLQSTTSNGGFNLKFRKRLILSGGNLRVKQIIEQFKTVKSSLFTFDKKWTQSHSLYTGLDVNRLVCLRTKGRKMPKAHLILIECGSYLRVD